ncbi:phage tail assembly protein [Mesorhizobium sp. Cs1299R1N3]|uniref:phage tail assembly protein n=1 Tax=Mesorhizobium sp. Cs1299R1N3 TaxID=3015173 RepID=UPI00301E3207
METKTYTLQHPVPLPSKPGEPAGSQLASITFRRPKAKDLIAIEKAAKHGLSAANVAIIAALGDISVEVAGELDAVDYEAASEFAADFFPKLTPPQPTGGASK